jgi:outer membrane protein assembly factor BamB
MMNEVLHDRSGYDVAAWDVLGDGEPLLFVTAAGKLLGLDPVSFEPRLEATLPADDPWLLLGAERVRPGQGLSLLLAGQDGLHVVQPDGREAARIEVHDLTPRAPIVARLRPDDPPVVLISPGNRDVVALDGPSLITGRPRGLWQRRRLAGFQAPTVCDLDGDGEQEVVLCHQTSGEVIVLDASGVLKRRLGSLPTDGTPLATGTAAPGRFGDGSRLLLGAVSGIGPNDGIARWTTLDPADGRVIWSREGGPHPRRTPAVVDANADGVDDLVYSFYFDVCIADGRTGEFLSHGPGVAPGYHLALVADLDASGTPSVLLSGGYGAIYRFDLQGKERWRSPTLDYNAGSAAAVGDVDGDGRLEFGVAFADRFGCYDAATGALRWELPLPGKGSDVVCCDIDGDERPEFLFGCADGCLYAVQADREGAAGHVLWRAPLGAPAGQPVIADLDGDGQAEILVCTQDGSLRVLAPGG